MKAKDRPFTAELHPDDLRLPRAPLAGNFRRARAIRRAGPYGLHLQQLRPLWSVVFPHRRGCRDPCCSQTTDPADFIAAFERNYRRVAPLLLRRDPTDAEITGVLRKANNLRSLIHNLVLSGLFRWK